jgi:hypothetical protein
MKTMKLELAPGEMTTIRMALIYWAERCKAEAKIMDDWAKDPNLNPEQCKRNAEASRSFKAEADALLEKLP